MWTREGHTPEASPASAPPVPRGETLATCIRQRGDELRVSLEEFDGHEFANLRIWNRSDRGYWPTKTGCSVRLSELSAVIDALVQVRERVEGPETVPRGYLGTEEERPKYVPPRRRRLG